MSTAPTDLGPDDDRDDESGDTDSRGRRRGANGNRTFRATRDNIRSQIGDILDHVGHVAPHHRILLADRAGVSRRTIDRWVAGVLDERFHRATGQALTDLDADDTPTASAGPPAGTAGDAGSAADGSADDDEVWAQTRVQRAVKAQVDVAQLPVALYKHLDNDRLILTPTEIGFFAQHTVIGDAVEAVQSDPHHRLRHFASSTLYRAWANVSEPVRVGARYGAKKQREMEATYALTGRECINESWSIDEYDLKLTATDENGIEVEPKVLVVRERRSGTRLAHLVRTKAMTGDDTAVVLAAAAIGFTTAHPRRPDEELRVAGVARFLNTDQGSPFIGGNGLAAVRRLGLNLAPIPTKQPQANGDHETMHKVLLRHFADGPGSRRGWTDRAAKRGNHGVPPMTWVEQEVADCLDALDNTPYTDGYRTGRTRLEVLADELDAGNVYDGHTISTADEAACATWLTERSWHPSSGIKLDKTYWLSPEVARKVGKTKKDRRLVIKMLLNPDVLYAFDADDTFLGVLVPRDDQDPVDVVTLHAERNLRSAITAQAGNARAQAALEGAIEAQNQAAAHYDEVADGLADAQDHAQADLYRALANTSRAIVRQALTVVPDVAPDPADDRHDQGDQDAGAADAVETDLTDGQGTSPAAGTASDIPAVTAVAPRPRKGRTGDRRLAAHHRQVDAEAATEAEADAMQDELAAEYLAARNGPHPLADDALGNPT